MVNLKLIIIWFAGMFLCSSYIIIRSFILMIKISESKDKKEIKELKKREAD